MTASSRGARIRLARSPGHLLGAPIVLLLLGALLIVAALVALEATPRLVLAVIGGAFILAGLAVAAMALSIRVMADDDALVVSSVLGSRRHRLAPGPVTRLAVHGPDAVPLRSRSLGGAWAFGRATLRGDERIWIVRLAPVDALVLVPTDLGRLAIAPRSEQELLTRLAEIGRQQQSADDGREAAPASTAAPAPVAPLAAPDPVPRLLTGIERSIVWDLLEAARLEEEAAAHQAAADEAARAEEANVAQAAPSAASPPTERAERRRWRFGRRRSVSSEPVTEPEPAPLVMVVPPGEVELHAPLPVEIDAEAAAPSIAAAPPIRVEPEPSVERTLRVEPAPIAVAAPAAPAARATPARRRRRSRLRRRVDRLLSLPPAARVLGIVFIALPLAIVVIGWFAADRLGTLPESVVGLRSVALAMLLIGPVTALAAILARAAAPRLVGLVVLSAMVAVVVTARALMP